MESRLLAPPEKSDCYPFSCPVTPRELLRAAEKPMAKKRCRLLGLDISANGQLRCRWGCWGRHMSPYTKTWQPKNMKLKRYISSSRYVTLPKWFVRQKEGVERVVREKENPQFPHPRKEIPSHHFRCFSRGGKSEGEEWASEHPRAVFFSEAATGAASMRGRWPRSLARCDIITKQQPKPLVQRPV